MASLTDRLANFGFAPMQRQTRTSSSYSESFSKAQSLGSAALREPIAGAGREPSSPSGDAGVTVLVRCRPALLSGEALVRISADAIHDKVLLRLQPSDEASPSRSSSASLPRSFRCHRYCGPSSTQQEVFEAAIPVVERAMQGFNGTILCYGATGSGKTFTMSGPPKDSGSDATGILQWVSRRIFEYIRDRSSRGQVFSVEASYLEIHPVDGGQEELIDLLAAQGKELVVKQDPLSSNSFACDGLQRVGIRTPDEMCEVLSKGQQKRAFLETSRNYHSSSSHCLLQLSVECLSESESGQEPTVRRGKLLLADLAGSESSRRSQAVGVDRVFASLSGVVHNGGSALSEAYRESSLTMLLHDCLGGSARALLVATVSPEVEGLDETVRTLTFAQEMLAVRSVPNLNRIEQAGDQSKLMQMRRRHADCIRILEEKTVEAKDEELEERKILKQEMDDLNQRLLTKESAETTLQDIRAEQIEKIDEMREEMTQAMTKELEKMRQQSLQDLHSLRQSVEKHVNHVDDTHHVRHAEEHGARLGKIQAELQTAVRSQRTIEEEAADLRVRLASAEERAKMLQQRQEELRKERSNFDEERKSLRQQSEQQWQKLTFVEGETQRFKAEVEVQRADLVRLQAARAEDAEKTRLEAEVWRAKEAELHREAGELRQRLEGAKREAELEALKLESQRREACTQLRAHIERLEVEAAAQLEQLGAARRLQAQLEAERAEAAQREEALRQQGSFELKQCKDELDEATEREKELMQMLHEVQEGIISASGAPSESS